MLIDTRKKLAEYQKLKQEVKDCDSFDVSTVLILVEAAQCQQINTVNYCVRQCKNEFNY